MTVSTHVYSAVLIGSPDLDLSLRGGSITLDAGRAPHVEGTINIALPDADTLAALDPRESARVRIEVDGEFPSFSQHREFDLALRDRDVQHADAVVTLALASDEALLNDHAPLADDDTPLSLATSLRAVIDYVLDEAIPGAALEASPALDADTTPYWAVTNLHPNPACNSTVAGFGGGSGASALTWVNFGGNGAVRWTAAAGVSNLIAADSLTAYRVTPGRWYTFRISVRSQVSRTVQAAIQWRSNGSASTLATIYGSASATSTTGFTDYTVTALAPQGAEYMYPLVLTTGNTAGQFHYADNALIYEGRFLIPYFDGATSDGGGYTYDWADPAAPHASASTRVPDIERDPESLVWRAGQTALDFLHPLIQAAGYRLVCDESRAWTLRDETYAADGAIDIRHGVNLINGTDSISRDGGLWFDAAVTTYRWTDAAGAQQERIDAYALSIPYTRLRTFEKDTPYPGPGFSEYAVRRAQGRGREISATAVADWRAHAEQASTFILDGAPTQIGAASRVEFDLNTDEMTVSSRTTDTPEGAIDLLTGTIDALTGDIDDL